MADLQHERDIFLARNIVKLKRTVQFRDAHPGLIALGGASNEALDLRAWIQERIDEGDIVINAGTIGVLADDPISGDGTAGTPLGIMNDGITNAHLANMPGFTIKGNNQPGSGDPVDLTISQTQGLLSIDNLITLTGVAEGSNHLGTFSGSTIPDNSTIYTALQALESAIVPAQTLSFFDPNLSISGGNSVDISGVNYWSKSGSNLYYTAGSVGVGIVPTRPFHVLGHSWLNGQTGIGNIDPTITATMLSVRSANPSTRVVQFLNNVNHTFISFDQRSDTAMTMTLRHFDETDTKNIFFDPTGDSYFGNPSSNVGIGTTSPVRLLHVNGFARISGSVGVPTVILGRDALGDLSNLTLGAGFSIVGGELQFSGGGGYTDEQAQDAFDSLLIASPTIDKFYDDALNQMQLSCRTQLSITSDSNGLMLVNDLLSPGNSKYYGTNGAGSKGWFSIADTNIGNTNQVLTGARTLSISTHTLDILYNGGVSALNISSGGFQFNSPDETQQLFLTNTNFNIGAITKIDARLEAELIMGNGLAPTSSVNTAVAGTGATLVFTSGQATDVAGRFTLTTGTGTTFPGKIADITFSGTYPVRPIVHLGYENVAASVLKGSLYTIPTATGFELWVDPTASGLFIDSTIYGISYIAVGPKA